MKSPLAVLLTLACFSGACFSVTALGQSLTPVVDLNSQSDSAQNMDSTTNVDGAVNAGQAAGDRYYQMQVLQQEVQMLRGMVEELNHELQQLKQRQMDDYLDIDRRLSAIVSSAPANNALANNALANRAPANNAPANSRPGSSSAALDAKNSTDSSGYSLNPAGSNNPSAAKVAAGPSELAEMKANYENASSLLLKKRDINGAALAFKQHVVDYASSPYVANAYYWLGEIYLLQDQAELSRQAFTSVIEQYPLHSKAMDARFKLGKLYHQLGEDARARELLETAATSSGGVAKKALAYLNNNF
ncbi:tetratricopeptide repeat protein [Porticoccaceae bacterium]|nr:tetratricopeptide repeat protein [Porticoccaceae bacterium]MDC0134145.1 tetratricopeptide repeat protein [Porticoccaceae bacterium]MDC1477632.1 tetratricopeptide repeat protein [Porticoccaceae bacterium]